MSYNSRQLKTKVKDYCSNFQAKASLISNKINELKANYCKLNFVDDSSGVNSFMLERLNNAEKSLDDMVYEVCGSYGSYTGGFTKDVIDEIDKADES